MSRCPTFLRPLLRLVEDGDPVTLGTVVRRISAIVILLLLAGLLPATGGVGHAPPKLDQLSLSELEDLQTDIDSELGQLASYALRGGTGSVGFHSKPHPKAETQEAFRIELGDEFFIDQVVLVPTLWREPHAGLVAEGFPIEFRILAGTDDTITEVASFSADDKLMPRIAPLAVPIEPVRASWVTVEATVLSSRIFEDSYLLQLAEIMVFSGSANVAAQNKVGSRDFVEANFHPSFLTDGFTPYLMDARDEEGSQAMLIRVSSSNPLPTLTIDLKTPQSVNQVNLHTFDTPPSIPMKNFIGYATPRHVEVTGATRPDFSDETLLCEYQLNSIADDGPIITRSFPETRCRYVRVNILDHRPVISRNPNRNVIAFSEIEVLSGDRNAAAGATVSANRSLSVSKEALFRMTDAHNYYGEILSIREWMNQLSRRHDLEALRPLVAEELGVRYLRQKARLRWTASLVALLVAGIVFVIVFDRFRHLREITRIKERFAADLHDQLGANLHTIGLLSDLAEESRQDDVEFSGIMRRIRDVTRRSGLSVRNMADLLESQELFSGLEPDMQRIAERISPQLDHELVIEGREHLQQLRQRTSVDLFLFYKECLVNICRHSGASQLRTHLKVDPREILLTISDNGEGLPESLKDQIPHSLERRARLLKARLKVESSPGEGTCITLRLRRRWRMLPFSPIGSGPSCAPTTPQKTS
ncbi:sensor histidine kinase [Haloferula chungangensis]|uniref:histidine kinase n=1 Tax=Haloferula chungangensis TaxID=1048331 RepID=A0ABW2L8J6_9BACT